MVVIRLTRIGKKKQAFYRVVAADKQRFVNSKFIEILGWYNPKTKEVNLKSDRISEWLAKGAQPSNTVAKLLKDNGVKLPDWVEITEKVRKPKKETPEKPKAEVKEPTAEVAPEVEKTEEVAPDQESPVETVEVVADTPEVPAEATDTAETAEAITEEQADEIEEKAEEAEAKEETE